jgi:hypothetical protein
VANNWIQGAIKRPGALTKKAKKAGAVTKKGTIEADWLNDQAKKSGKTGQQARLAKTLKKLSRKRGK